MAAWPAGGWYGSSGRAGFEARCETGFPGIGFVLHGYWTHRKPVSTLRSAGDRCPRTETRIASGRSTQEPPRRTFV